MRSFVGFVVFVAALVALLAIVAVPLVAQPLIASIVRDAVPFEEAPLEVKVDAGLGLLDGSVDRVVIHGTDLASGRTTIESLDLEIRNVGILDRSFTEIDGSLLGLVLALEDGTTLDVGSIVLGGSSVALEATAMLDAAATERLVRASLAGTGIAPDNVILGPDGVDIEAAGMLVRARPEIRGGALYLVPDELLPPLAILAPEDGDPWRVTDVSSGAAGLTLVGTIDGRALLGG